MRLCTQCLKRAGDPTPWCTANPGRGCLYGLEHLHDSEPVQKQTKKKDMRLCAKCGLHPKNPASGTNGCAHEYISRQEWEDRIDIEMAERVMKDIEAHPERLISAEEAERRIALMRRRE